jgi:hypothetical protein
MLAGSLSLDRRSLDGCLPRLFGPRSRTADADVSWFDNPDKVDWWDAGVASPNFRKAAAMQS